MRLALLGDPVGHSRSPAIHTAALAAVGIEGTYEARRTDASGVSRAIGEIRAGGLDGANVTMPLKRVALDGVDSASVEAIAAGAVNTIALRDGAVIGENTDVGGIADLWTRCDLPADAPVLVLGAGGAAGAALVALVGRPVTIAARRREMAERLVAFSGSDATVGEWGVPVGGAVVVNATPIGMRGEELPAGLLEGATGLVDMAYGSGQTPAVAACRGRLPVADGIDLLVAQAARSFTVWTGVPAPIQVMESAARA